MQWHTLAKHFYTGVLMTATPFVRAIFSSSLAMNSLKKELTARLPLPYRMIRMREEETKIGSELGSPSRRQWLRQRGSRVRV